MYFESSEAKEKIIAPMDIQLVLSINAVLVLVVGLFPDVWMKWSLSLFL
jgi:NADH-quinone oxidoreductase subunit N